MAGMRSYKSLELDDDDALDRMIAIPGGGNETPQFPYGMRLSMDEATLKALGVDDGDEPEVGDLLHFAAFARVTSYTKTDDGGGKTRRVELQIEMISCIENESTEFDGG